MAHPKLEDGYLKISNEIVEQFCQLNLNQSQWKLLWTILRKTYGFNKKSDKISLSQLSKMTKISICNIPRNINHLILKGIIKKTDCVDRIGTTYSLQKDYEKWILSEQTVSKQTVSELNNSTIRTDETPLSELIDTKDNTKDNIQKTYTPHPQKAKKEKSEKAVESAGDRVYALYKDLIRPGARVDAVRSINALVKNKIASEEVLKECVKNYHTVLERKKNGKHESDERQFRLQANNFFGRAQRYTDYLEPVKLTPTEEADAFINRLKQEIRQS